MPLLLGTLTALRNEFFIALNIKTEKTSIILSRSQLLFNPLQLTKSQIKKALWKTRKPERHLHVRNWFTQFLKVRSCVMTSFAQQQLSLHIDSSHRLFYYKVHKMSRKNQLPIKELINNANCRDRTGDLILTMDALCLLS